MEHAWIQIPGREDDVRLAYRKGSSDEAVLDEIFGPGDVYHLRHDPMRDAIAGKVVIDAGANIGAFAACCLALGAAHVVCFEPDEANLQLLEENLARYGTSATISPVALGEPGARVALVGEGANVVAVPPEGPEMPGQLMSCLGFSQALQIADESVSEALRALRIGLLKIDIEGAEYDWLASASRDDMLRIDRITIEWHSWGAEQARYGELMTKLAWTHSVSVFGQPDQGGHIHAHPYA